MSAVWNPIVKQGTTFRRVLRWLDSNEVPIDLTGYTAEWRIWNTQDEALEYVATTENGGITIDGPAGEMEVVIPADDTATLPLGIVIKHQLDITLVAEVTRLIEGRLNIKRMFV